MARPSSAATRNLSLPEELERLEQSITLTLQEIDSNFAKAHRIVTTSVLPIVERYAKNSEQVWDGSKFWRQFFEAAGDITFNNYSVPAGEDTTINSDEGDEEETEVEQSVANTEQELYTSPSQTPRGNRHHEDTGSTITSPAITTQIVHPDSDSYDDDDPILSSPSLAHNHSTPRLPPDSTVKGKNKAPSSRQVAASAAHIADYGSPYEAMRRELHGEPEPSPSKRNPVTPGKRLPALPDVSMTPGSSPFAVPQSAYRTGGNRDAVLHSGMLGMQYRVAATPMTARKKAMRSFEDLSSPIGEEPQLNLEGFSSPVRAGHTVQSPRKKDHIEKAREDRRRSLKGLAGSKWEKQQEELPRGRADFNIKSRIGWDSDDDDEMPEFSPPKTLRFEFGEAKIVQTPAREASRRIVEDLLHDAGADDDDLPEEYSPSIVVRNTNYQDDTF